MNGMKLSAVEQRQLWETLERTRDVRQYRRILAVLEWGRGKPVSEVAQSLHVTRQSVHNWVTRFRYAGKAVALTDAPRCGRPRRLGDAVDTLLQALMMLPPERCGYHATHWTVPLLQDQLRRNLGQAYCDATIRRVLHRLGYVWKRPRYVLAADPQREKKTLHSARTWQLATAQRGPGAG